jgi:hypothetical protein
LNNDKKLGTALSPAIHLSNKHISKASIASVALALFIIDGVLLQRASTTGLALQSTQQSLRIMQSPEVPIGFSGSVRDFIFYPTHNAVNIVNDWVHKHPIDIDVTGCEGVCSGTVRGPVMVKTNCTTRTWPITSKILHSPNASWGTWKGVDSSQVKGVVFNVLPQFEIKLLALGDAGKPDGAWLQVGRVNYFDLEGGYIQEACYFDQEFSETYAAQRAGYGRRPRKGHIRLAMLNAAVDEDLARSIFDTIANAKPKGDRTLPFERLELAPFRGAYTEEASEAIDVVAQWWLVERDQRADHRDQIIATENRFSEDLTEEYGPPAGLDPGIESIFRKIWPGNPDKASDWTLDWTSLPLALESLSRIELELLYPSNRSSVWHKS